MRSDLLAEAIARLDTALTVSPSRRQENGPHELKEFGPALKATMEEVWGAANVEGHVVLNGRLPMKNFNRPISEVDLVLYPRDRSGIDFAAELKCWDIGHQLFDLAKVCCLLATEVPAGVLICAARRSQHFDSMPGGELFHAAAGQTSEHDLLELIRRHAEEWKRHVGKKTPEPTSVPTRVSTTTIVAGVGLDAYPEHEVRAVEVSVIDATPVDLVDGWPLGVGPRKAP